MKIDIPEQIGAVEREVREAERDGQRVQVVVARRSYDTTVDDVWDAISNPERLPRWFLPVTGDLREGGRYRLEGNAEGTIERCEPPTHLAVTWEFGGGVSWLEVRLTAESPQRTQLELAHAAPEDDHWRTYGPGAGGVGWDLGLLGLTAHLGGAARVDPEEAAAWSASAEGKGFIRDSSEGWYRAWVEAGQDEATAREAAAKTTAFYTGEGA